MITLLSIKANNLDITDPVSQSYNSVVASWNWKLERFINRIETAIRHAHTPNKVFNVNNILLMRLLRKYNHNTPGSLIALDSFITTLLSYLIHKYF